MNIHYNKAIEWIRMNTIDEQGIVVSSKQRWPYLAMTGHLIPTLMEAGQEALALQYAEFLSYMQRPNGSFKGPDGVEYVFDSALALRGLLSAARRWDKFKSFAQKCADYIASSMGTDGKSPINHHGTIPEACHVYALPALFEAAKVLNKPEYRKISQKALQYYKKLPDILSNGCLSHDFAYIIDGFIDMGETDFVRPAVKNAFMHHTRWICSAGLAQFGIIAYKLQMKEETDKAIQHLMKLQNSTGGFLGSYGLGAPYFPKEEISWATKFFIDLVHLTEGPIPKGEKAIEKLDREQWPGAMIDETVDEIFDRIRKNNFAVWCKPLLEKTSAADSVLELGSGTGELSAVLGSYGRSLCLLDYSPQSIEFSKALLNKLGLNADYYVADILKELPLKNNSVDWVFSSGVLEHFSDKQIVSIMKKSAAVARKGVMSLVPNSHCLFYRIGKYAQEKTGKWLYGKELPKVSMKPYFEAASLKHIRENSIGTYHALRFFGKNDKDIRAYLNTLGPQEISEMNQGYLLFTYGEKNA